MHDRHTFLHTKRTRRLEKPVIPGRYCEIRDLHDKQETGT